MGAYAMSTLYGRQVPIGQGPAELGEARKSRVCPPCPHCKTCLPPVDCKVAPPVIAPGDETGMMEHQSDVVANERGKAGLSAKAMVLAIKSLNVGVQNCRSSTTAAAWAGSVVLDLTVTATGGWGRISNASVIQTDGQVAGFGQCLINAAGETQFEWTFSDGEGKIRQAFSAKP